MPATDYRVMQIPNWKAGWSTIAPRLADGLGLLQNVILHTHTIAQAPTNVSIKSGWLVVTMSDRLDPALEQHLGISPV